MTLAEIAWGKLGELLWAAPAAGIVVALTFSVLILGFSRASESRRAGAMGRAAGFGALGTGGGVLFLAAVVFGIAEIVTK